MAVTKRLNWLKWLYPGEAGLQSEQGWLIDKRRAHMSGEHLSGVTSGLEVLETSPTPDLEVHVQPGRGIDGDGEEVVFTSAVDVDLSSYASGGATVKIVAEYDETGTDPYIVPETATSQDKFLQDDPKVTAITGTPSAKQVLLAQVVVSNGATQITDAADPDNPGTDEIDLRGRDATTPRGFRAVQDLSGDAELSTVTVGEYGCDFNDLRNAVAYANGLTRSKDRQVDILLFGKRNGQYWSIASAITIPSWTHFIGIGKPTIKTTVTSAVNVITLNEGASLHNVYIEIGSVGWTAQVYSASDDPKIENVDIRYEQNSVDADYAIVLSDTDRAVVRECRLFPYSSDDTKGCRALKMTGTCKDISIVDCIFEGDVELLELSGGGMTGTLSNIILTAHATTGTNALGSLSGFLVVSNIHGTCVAGPTYGLQLGSDAIVSSNILVQCTTNDDMFGLRVGGGHHSNIFVSSCRLEVSVTADKATIRGGRVDYTADDTLSSIVVGASNCIISNIYANRGSPSAAAAVMEPGTNADEVIVTGCLFDNTNGASIKNNQAGATNWLVHGNMVDVATPAGNGWTISDEVVI